MWEAKVHLLIDEYSRLNQTIFLNDIKGKKKIIWINILFVRWWDIGLLLCLPIYFVNCLVGIMINECYSRLEYTSVLKWNNSGQLSNSFPHIKDTEQNWML